MKYRNDGICPHCQIRPRRVRAGGRPRAYCGPCEKEKARNPPAGARELLSPQATAVLLMMCQGLCIKLIARRMGTAPSTVKHHQHMLRARTKSKSQAMLGVWAVEHGYYSTPVQHSNGYARPDEVPAAATAAGI